MDLKEAQERASIEVDGKWGPVTAEAILKFLPFNSELLSLELSPHFTLGEMLKSDTAERQKIKNYPTVQQLLNLVQLCNNILEPVREHYGKPVRVTSGFRIFTPSSQHGKGEAADFEVPGVRNLDVAKWIRDNLRFDQLILEAYGVGNAGWIHCSYRKDKARKDVLRTPTGKAPYFKGLPS
jgi:hypothetical protein